MKAVVTIIALLIAGCRPALGLDPSLDITQYAHTAWTIRDGFFKGSIFSIAQTPDGYLWLGTEFGLVRFDGVRTIPLPPPSDKRLLAGGIHRLLAAKDGTLWIGAFVGVVSLKDGELVSHPELGKDGVMSLFEDRDGTVWAGSLWAPKGRLCAFRGRSAQCYGDDGALGHFVSDVLQDPSGTLWVGSQSGLWRWRPEPSRRYEIPLQKPASESPGMGGPGQISALNQADDGRLLIATYGAGLLQLAGDKVQRYPIRAAANPRRTLKDAELNSNLLLRDRDGGLWIGTVERGLIHVHQGRTDVFTTSNGLSGDVILSLFEDREGNIWVGTSGGLDRFRELPFTNISAREGLSSDDTQSVLAAADGSVWVGTHDGLTRWKDGQPTVFRMASGLPDDAIQSLYQDHAARIWVATGHGLAQFQRNRLAPSNAVRVRDVHWITGDKAGNLWLSEDRGLLHLRDGTLVEQISWPETGRPESAKVLLSDDEGGVWLGFWSDGGVAYIKEGKVRASYTIANGLTEGPVADFHFGSDGALWISTEWGGLNRLKDGRIVALTSKNGLPCDVIHWATEDDDGAFWLYTACGLVRIQRTQLEAWIADPKRRIETAVWDAADGIRLRSFAASRYGPRAAKASDGKLWFVTGEGVQVIDPRHLNANQLPPPVHIEEVVADKKTYLRNIMGTPATAQRLPARTHDLQINFTALSLVAQEKVKFKYKLEGQDSDWREIVNTRQVQYTNLAPGSYRFRVIACNNSGVWNEQGATLDFVIPPAWYQTNWFYTLCAAAFLATLWVAYQLRMRQLAYQFNLRVEERVRERTRIARDLHDTLLQSFHGLLLRFQTGINLLGTRPGDGRKLLEDAVEDASQAIAEGRDAIAGLRTTVEKNDLDLAIETVGQEIAASQESSAQFRLSVEGTPRELHPILRDEVYRLATEALRNSFRHAAPNNVEVEIRYDAEYLRLRVRDDGKGINEEVLRREGRQGHYGLHGMRERATVVGGELTIWTELNSGTEIELVIPAAKAYLKSARPFWFFGRSVAPETKENETIGRD